MMWLFGLWPRPKPRPDIEELYADTMRRYPNTMDRLARLSPKKRMEKRRQDEMTARLREGR